MAITKQSIGQERAKGESTQATLSKEREELFQQQVEIQNQISNAQKELKQVQTELEKTVIRTTQAGTILKLELRNPGQVVRLGDVIAQIAPSNTPLVVKARVAAFYPRIVSTHSYPGSQPPNTNIQNPSNQSC